MPELDPKIAAWRVDLLRVVGGDEALADELEDHLRLSIAALRQQGSSAEAAFAQAVARLGESRGIAVQYRQVRPVRNFDLMNALRIVATVALGGYLLAMGLQLIAVSVEAAKDLAGIALDQHGAKTAFFPNLLVCALCAIGIWAVWRSARPDRKLEP